MFFLEGHYFLDILHNLHSLSFILSLIFLSFPHHFSIFETNFQLLYNPNGAAQFTWLPWDQGTGNVNFPTGVVKSDESQSCNFMLARYNDYNETGFVDSEGYVYYVNSVWDWDDNEYDLLIERPAKSG